MSTKENFVKALKELTGFDEGTAPAQQVNTPSSVTRVDSIVFETDVKKDESVFSGNLKESFAKIDRDEFGTQGEAKTCIPKGMRVIGNLESSDRIEMLGRVEGDISTDKDVVIAGAVVGNIATNNMLLQKGAIKGNIRAKGDILVEQTAMIIGNVKANNLKLDGKVKGDITVENMSEFTSGAVVSGNIETNMFSINRGTKIKGSIVTRQNGDFDEDAEFDVEV